MRTWTLIVLIGLSAPAVADDPPALRPGQVRLTLSDSDQPVVGRLDRRVIDLKTGQQKLTIPWMAIREIRSGPDAEAGGLTVTTRSGASLVGTLADEPMKFIGADGKTRPLKSADIKLLVASTAPAEVPKTADCEVVLKDGGRFFGNLRHSALRVEVDGKRQTVRTQQIRRLMRLDSGAWQCVGDDDQAVELKLLNDEITFGVAGLTRPLKLKSEELVAFRMLPADQRGAPAEDVLSSPASMQLTAPKVGDEGAAGPTTREADKKKDKSKFYDIEYEPTSAVFVLDKSNSMQDHDRWERLLAELKKTLTDVHEKNAESKFHIILYAGAVTGTKSMPPSRRGDPLLRPASARNVAAALKWVASFSPSGSTNPKTALEMAIQLRPAVIFFMSDGEFSSLNRRYILEFRKRYRAKRMVINTISLGADNDLLRQIAKENDGDYTMVPDPAPGRRR